MPDLPKSRADLRVGLQITNTSDGARGADTRVCRVETRLDAWPGCRSNQEPRHECRGRRHECPRHEASAELSRTSCQFISRQVKRHYFRSSMN